MKLSTCLAAIVALVPSGLMIANAQEEPPCTTTLEVFPTIGNLFTTTIYETTVTETSEVDCSGCVLVVTTAHLGPGPKKSITATEYDYATTTTVFACEETAAAKEL